MWTQFSFWRLASSDIRRCCAPALVADIVQVRQKWERILGTSGVRVAAFGDRSKCERFLRFGVTGVTGVDGLTGDAGDSEEEIPQVFRKMGKWVPSLSTRAGG